jgi:hypothetical protein
LKVSTEELMKNVYDDVQIVDIPKQLHIPSPVG